MKKLSLMACAVIVALSLSACTTLTPPAPCCGQMKCCSGKMTCCTDKKGCCCCDGNVANGAAGNGNGCPPRR